MLKLDYCIDDFPKESDAKRPDAIYGIRVGAKVYPICIDENDIRSDRDTRGRFQGNIGIGVLAESDIKNIVSKVKLSVLDVTSIKTEWRFTKEHIRIVRNDVLNTLDDVRLILFDNVSENIKDNLIMVGFVIANLGDIYDTTNVRSVVLGKDVERKVQVKSSSSDRIYEVLHYEDGSKSCNCPGWANRKTCKHLSMS